MTDDPAMSSADSAAAASAAEAILAAIEKRFECVDGPPTAFAEYTISADGGKPDPGKQWMRERGVYRVALYGCLDTGYGSRETPLGAKTLAALVEAYPDFIEQALLHENRMRASDEMRIADNLRLLTMEPGQERLVWRVKPEVTQRDGRWHAYCRFGFMPKNGVLLPMEEN